MDKNGLLLIDKPAGWSSHDVVAKTRRILNMKSVGHCGTLDPMATGLMVLLLGEATKLSQYILERDKAYRLKALFGVRTTTYDLEGDVVSQVEPPVKREELAKAAAAHVGEFEWGVPPFSAVKVKGEKLYDKARRGEVFETPRKIMKFFDFSLVSSGENWVEADIGCSKGSYIRSWVHELGEQLGFGATLMSLRRTKSAPYSLDQAVTFEELEVMAQAGEWKRGFLPMAEALDHWKTVRAKGMTAHLLNNGQISHDLKAQLIRVVDPAVDAGVKVLTADGQLLALVGLEPGKGFVIRRVFRY